MKWFPGRKILPIHFCVLDFEKKIGIYYNSSLKGADMNGENETIKETPYGIADYLFWPGTFFGTYRGSEIGINLGGALGIGWL